MKTAKIILSLSACAFISACSSGDVEYTYPEKYGDGKYTSSGEKPDSIFGEDGYLPSQSCQLRQYPYKAPLYKIYHPQHHIWWT